MTMCSGFEDGSSRHTLNLASTALVLFFPTRDLVSSGRTCLGIATNNLAEYHALTGLLTSDMSHIKVYLDSELVL